MPIVKYNMQVASMQHPSRKNNPNDRQTIVDIAFCALFHFTFIFVVHAQILYETTTEETRRAE
jgi:hypothetical protein